MELFFRETGQGMPVVIVHGLYGSSDNWVGFGKMLASSCRVILVDQRNHGRSPHHPDMSYNAMSDDLRKLIENNIQEKPVLIGHSMGGRTAMTFASRFPEMVRGLIVLDVAPKAYSHTPEAAFQQQVLSALQALRIEQLSSRTEAEKQLTNETGSERLAQFLLKNLYRDDSGRYRWRVNLQAIAQHFNTLFDTEVNPADSEKLSQLPVCFIRGERSGYLSPDDLPAIHERFPGASLEAIAEAGHWLHAEQPERLLEVIRHFLSRQIQPVPGQ